MIEKMGIFDWFGKKEQANDDLDERIQNNNIIVV
jgi:hypothetical protein